MTWFKNLAAFQMTPIDHIAPHTIGAKLRLYNESLNFPDFPVERYSFTFPPGCNNLAQPVYGTHVILNLCVERKTLPKQVVDRETEKERRKIYNDKGFYPGRDMAREIRERVITDLADRAFVDESFYPIWIDLKHGWLGVDTPSPKRADDAARVLSHAIDGLDPIYLCTIKGVTPPAGVDRSNRGAMCEDFRIRLRTMMR